MLEEKPEDACAETESPVETSGILLKTETVHAETEIPHADTESEQGNEPVHIEVTREDEVVQEGIEGGQREGIQETDETVHVQAEVAQQSILATQHVEAMNIDRGNEDNTQTDYMDIDEL